MSIYESQIRSSQLSALLDKVQKRRYGQYLLSVALEKIRGFTDSRVDFDFPVTAIIGPNGGGKTTVLGAAACAYADVKPRRFFPKSGKLDDSMAEWKIVYHAVDRDLKANDVVSRTATFRQAKWSREGLSRTVRVFGIGRTLPAIERSALSYYGTNATSFVGLEQTALTSDVIGFVGQILGKDVSKHAQIRLADGQDLLVGRTSQNASYSEFHFGAGESSIIRMVAEIESLPENSLVLIEEIENGLHPLATMRMVEYLVTVAERKKIQSIFTTHSNDALTPLPDQAVWAAVNNNVFQGKLTVESLRAITGRVTKGLVIFVEDEFAKAWLEAILRNDGDYELLDRVEIHAMSGDGSAVRVNKFHNSDPSVSAPSACYIDGDSKQATSDADRVYRLPGNMPESYVFDAVMDDAAVLGGQMAVMLHQPFEKHETVQQKLREVRRDCKDAHLLFLFAGKALGLVPEKTVRDAFLTAWARTHQTEAEVVRSQVRHLLDPVI